MRPLIYCLSPTFTRKNGSLLLAEDPASQVKLERQDNPRCQVQKHSWSTWLGNIPGRSVGELAPASRARCKASKIRAKLAQSVKFCLGGGKGFSNCPQRLTRTSATCRPHVSYSNPKMHPARHLLQLVETLGDRSASQALNALFKRLMLHAKLFQGHSGSQRFNSAWDKGQCKRVSHVVLILKTEYTRKNSPVTLMGCALF